MSNSQQMSDTSDGTREEMQWKVLNSRHIVRDPWVSLRADACVTPEGLLIEPYYVFEYPDWVNVVPVTSNLEVILIRQYRHGINRVLYEIPSGIIDPNDLSPEFAARRELLEETGYSSSGNLIPLAKLSANPATNNNIAHSFLALNVEKTEEQNLEPTEQIQIAKKTIPELVEMLDQNMVLQALHASALFYALKYLKKLN